ncbi:hypothetical protein ACOKW7_21900 [Limnospira platensis CENA597]|uniref:hypothetical protein n=1 Tax=Limnospira platensis TaxID=118562 RepID=UPI0001C3946A
MSLEEQARELLAQNRHHKQHLHETMRSRAEEEGDRPIIADSQGRELLAETRHHDEHIHETMLSRSSEGY